MTCSIAKIGDRTMIVCSRGHRPRSMRKCACGAAATLQCDWKLGNGRTCDRHLCARCATPVAIEKDLCPEHDIAYAAWKAANPELL